MKYNRNSFHFGTFEIFISFIMMAELSIGGFSNKDLHINEAYIYMTGRSLGSLIQQIIFCVDPLQKNNCIAEIAVDNTRNVGIGLVHFAYSDCK